MFYVCEKLVGLDKICDFCFGKIILQQLIDFVQMQKLLSDGKIDLLKEFVLNWMCCKFLVYLVVKDGKVGFEFEKKVVKFKVLVKKKVEV